MSANEANTAAVRRPGVITFIAAILFIQAATALTAMVTMLIWRRPILEFLEKEDSPLSNAGFTGTIVAEALSALVLVLVAAGLLRGSRGIRLLVAVVQGFSMAFAVYVLVGHHVGGYVYRAVFSLFVGVFVLWALYGNDESEAFFESDWP
jgi:hypothetical protein